VSAFVRTSPSLTFCFSKKIGSRVAPKSINRFVFFSSSPLFFSPSFLLFFFPLPHQIMSSSSALVLASATDPDAPQILTATATIDDARAAIERAFRLIQTHGVLTVKVLASENRNVNGVSGFGATVFGGRCNAVGTGAFVCGGRGHALGIGAVALGGGIARGVGSIQASASVSEDIQQLLAQYCQTVCAAASAHNPSLLVLPIA